MTLTIGSLKGGSWFSRYDAFWNTDGTIWVRTAGHHHVIVTPTDLRAALAMARSGKTGVVLESARAIGMLGEPHGIVVSVLPGGVVEIVQHNPWDKERHKSQRTKPARLTVTKWEGILSEVDRTYAEWGARMRDPARHASG